MEDRKKRDATNDNLNIQSDIMSDLPLANEQADETKGGESRVAHGLYSQRTIGISE